MYVSPRVNFLLCFASSSSGFLTDCGRDPGKKEVNDGFLDDVPDLPPECSRVGLKSPVASTVLPWVDFLEVAPPAWNFDLCSFSDGLLRCNPFFWGSESDGPELETDRVETLTEREEESKGPCLCKGLDAVAAAAQADDGQAERVVFPEPGFKGDAPSALEVQAFPLCSPPRLNFSGASESKYAQ